MSIGRHLKFYKRDLVIFLAAAFCTVAFAWPWQDQPAKKEPKKIVPDAEIESIRQELKLSIPATEKEPRERKEAAEPAAMPPARQEARPEVTGGIQPEAAEVLQLQERIQHIMQLNNQIEAVRRQKTQETTAILEQARIHQRILEDIRRVNPARKSYTTMDVEEILRQEKLRIMRAELEKNYQQLKKIEKTR